MEQPKPIGKVPTNSTLIGALHIASCLDLTRKTDAETKRGRPYAYNNNTMLRCYIVMMWMKLNSVNSLYKWLSRGDDFNTSVRKACGLEKMPDRRTFDRRFAKFNFKDLVGYMGKEFVIRDFVNAVIVAIDSTNMKAYRGHVHHKKDKEAGRVPRPGIDTEAAWTRKRSIWIYGYKLHIITVGDPARAVPLAACTTPANEADNKLAMDMFERLNLEVVEKLLGDQSYRDHKLYLAVREMIGKASGGKEGSLMTWSKNNSGKQGAGTRKGGPKKDGAPTRAELGKRAKAESDEEFATPEGKEIYDRRKESVEPAQGRIKDLFDLDTLPVRGKEAVDRYVLGCVFVYQMAIFYKCVMNLDDPMQVKGVLS